MMTGQAKVGAAQLRPPFGGDAPMIAAGGARAEARIRLDLEHSVEVLLDGVSGGGGGDADRRLRPR